MTLVLTGQAKHKLDHLPERLRDEFPRARPDAVEREVAEVAGALLEWARFDDFIPLLTYRYAREHLIDDEHAWQSAA